MRTLILLKDAKKVEYDAQMQYGQHLQGFIDKYRSQKCVLEAEERSHLVHAVALSVLIPPQIVMWVSLGTRAFAEP